MSSPTKTWIAVVLAIACAYFLYYNIAQIVDSGKALGDVHGPNSLKAAGVLDCDIWVGMIGTGCLLALYLIGTLIIFLNKREKTHLTKGSLTCYILVGVFILLAFASSSMAFVEYGKPPMTIFITTLTLSAFRLLLLGAMMGCGIHALRDDHS